MRISTRTRSRRRRSVFERNRNTGTMVRASSWLKVVSSLVLALAHSAAARSTTSELTPAGKAILEATIAGDGRPLSDRPGPTRPIVFPLAMCTFPGGLCGAVRRDGSVAVPPRYDWVGTFSSGRVAVRSGGLYGFVDETGREIVSPRYRIVGDYRFGFAQVDIDGKSGLIDRDGKLMIEPRYGFIQAIAPDRFRVADKRPLGEAIDVAQFPDESDAPQSDSSWVVGAPESTGTIDRNSQWIEPPGTRIFDPGERSVRIASRVFPRQGPAEILWGLQRGDGSWLVKPQFDQMNALGDGLARIRRTGRPASSIATVKSLSRPFSMKHGPSRQAPPTRRRGKPGAWARSTAPAPGYSKWRLVQSGELFPPKADCRSDGISSVARNGACSI
nr:WG repeat-containing protein [Bradyrhizobium iriomotense]